MANRTYIFFRENGFYLLGLPDDATAIHNAKNDLGTLRVQDSLTKETIWKAVGEPECCPKCYREAGQPDAVYSPSEWYCPFCDKYFMETKTI